MEKLLKYVETMSSEGGMVADLCNDLLGSDFQDLENDFERRNYIRSIGKEYPKTAEAVQRLLTGYDKVKDSL